MSGITAATDKTEMMYCQFSVVTEKLEIIKIEIDDLDEEFSADFLEEWT
jgi:hypothetical protein